MLKRTLLIIAWLLVFGSIHAQPQYVDPPVVGYPSRIIALGDSVSRAFFADGNTSRITDQPEYSWSTGTATQVNSFLRHVQAVNPSATGSNFAVSGNKVASLNAQASQTTGIADPFVTILIGANDVCVSNVSNMTSVADYRTAFSNALQTLSTNDPETRIFVASVPNVYALWQTFKNNLQAQQIWNSFQICQSMFANPTSTDPVDEGRRQAVRQRIVEYNTELANLCSNHLRCRFDDNLLFNTPITPTLITGDYYHPSIGGQNALANAEWTKMFDFNDNQAPISSVSWQAIPNTNQVTATITGTDNVAVRGFEYRLPNQTTWTRYTQALTLDVGTTIIVRAVDVNGNTEGSREWIMIVQPQTKVYLPLVTK